jgi:hypothetical protein
MLEQVLAGGFYFDQQKEVIEREIERLREEVGHE